MKVGDERRQLVRRHGMSPLFKNMNNVIVFQGVIKPYGEP
ncbi:hypothetical protein [Polaromonas sp. CG9_12]|nr:hypothetical protein [Polaromonas sp. CG9_12]